jgi:hypothetical protein
MDGQYSELVDRYDTLSRRIRITWDQPHRESSLQVKEPEELFLFYVPNQDSNNLEVENGPILANETEPIPQAHNREVYTMIRSWVRETDRYHESTQFGEENTKAFSDVISETWFWFVDVREMKLTQLPKNEKGEPKSYVALSYV